VAHTTGIERVVQAGAQPVTWVALAVELQRDWAREATVADVIEIVLTERLLKLATVCGERMSAKKRWSSSHTRVVPFEASCECYAVIKEEYHRLVTLA
jgi:hypothetical protein